MRPPFNGSSVARRVALLLVLLIGACALPSAGAAALEPQGVLPEAEDLLPDLDEWPPTRIAVVAARAGGKKRFRLIFDSAAANVGSGPLHVYGERAGAEGLTMPVSQIVHRSDGSTWVKPEVGVFRYTVSRDHQHWHYLAFMTYELRRASDIASPRRDRKTGFCLADYEDAFPDEVLPNEPPAPVFRHCGENEPGLPRLEQGLSVGRLDAYTRILEGQYIDVTGLPRGRYLLVLHVNEDRRLQESTYANNEASALLELTWPKGKDRKPRLKVLAVCPDSARCSVPTT
jgi:hypothetical protein